MNKHAANETLVGGQALIEGVMMKTFNSVGMAVRLPNGTIKTESQPFVSLLTTYRWLNIPLLRGCVVLFEMLRLGLRALNKSAKYASEDENDSGEHSSLVETAIVAGTLLFSVVMAIVLFKLLPLFVADSIHRFIPLSTLVYNLIEGVVKMGIFLGYILVITLLPDIYRVWQYHGAEHKVVRCHEEKKPLRASSAKTCSRLHPRCGTSFVIFVILLSIIVYLFIPTSWPFWLKLVARLALLPLIAGLSFELLRFAGKYPHSLLFRIISAPGLATQLLTTREPTKEQLEVAVRALRVALQQSSQKSQP